MKIERKTNTTNNPQLFPAWTFSITDVIVWAKDVFIFTDSMSKSQVIRIKDVESSLMFVPFNISQTLQTDEHHYRQVMIIIVRNWWCSHKDLQTVRTIYGEDASKKGPCNIGNQSCDISTFS